MPSVVYGAVELTGPVAPKNDAFQYMVDGDMVDCTSEIIEDACFEDIWMVLDDGSLTLPQSTDCSSIIGEGEVCWDSDSEILYIGTSSYALPITGGAGGDSWGDAVDSDILPTGADDTYDIGGVGAEFKDGYFDGTLEADEITENGLAVCTEAYADAQPGTHQANFVVYDDGEWASEEVPIWISPDDVTVTITKVSAAIMGSGADPSLDYNIEERAWGALGSAGTDLLSSDETVDTSGVIVTSFANAGITKMSHLVMTSGTDSPDSGTVNLIQGVIYYTK